MGMTYKDAGVDIHAGYKAVDLIKKHAGRTFDSRVMSGLGGFGGMYSLDLTNLRDPVLVSSTDGVGTKLQFAHLANKHDSIGKDCVAMCVNDIVCQGARPLFFLDYIATGKLSPEKVSDIVKGIADACIESKCSLIGGETAEMPGFYKEDEYDIAGFSVGIVSKDDIITGEKVQDGNDILGLASNGVHSNGYSFIRKILEKNPDLLTQYFDSLGCTLLEELLKPTCIYVGAVLGVLEKYSINGIAHITGGGFIENIPRAIPQGLKAEIQTESWPVSPIFQLLKKWGTIDKMEMFNTFNMGIGMVLITDPENTAGISNLLEENGYPNYLLGKVRTGVSGVEFKL